jgi:dihydroorotate dehydrogenase (NAD+) catalytic subunit
VRIARVGPTTLKSAVMTASGTAGYGTELDPYVPLASLGAFVAKSLAPFAWSGNPPPRLHPVAAGMLNAVGLQGPGIEQWLVDTLPALERVDATIVPSIWGFGVEDYRLAASMLAPHAARFAAIEVNLSCPNMSAQGTVHEIFAHNPELVASIVEAVAGSGLPVWAKLSPNTDRLVAIAGAAHDAGAAAVTLVNTALGMVIDTRTGRPALGNGGGGLSGRAIHPIAVRAVHSVYAQYPDLPIVGVGGVSSGVEAIELLMAGASAVQVGTATFADPRACRIVATQMEEWADQTGVSEWADIVGCVHRGGLSERG